MLSILWGACCWEQVLLSHDGDMRWEAQLEKNPTPQDWFLNEALEERKEGGPWMEHWAGLTDVCVLPLSELPSASWNNWRPPWKQGVCDGKRWRPCFITRFCFVRQQGEEVWDQVPRLDPFLITSYYIRLRRAPAWLTSPFTSDHDYNSLIICCPLWGDIDSYTLDYKALSGSVISDANWL